MPSESSFVFNPEKIERSFSSLQRVDDSVQAANSAVPGCCTRTALTVGCRSFERGYRLELPLKSRRANESTTPAHNQRLHVMAAQITPPVLQVLSVHEGNGIALIEVSAEGPNQCPSGVANRVALDGVGGGSREVPFKQWAWKAPAILNASLMESLDEDLIKLLHPFKAPNLPAQVWSLSVPACLKAQVRATVAAFPDVQWHGRLSARTAAAPAAAAGFSTQIEGNLACHYNGRQFPIVSRDQLRALSKWFDCLEMLGKSAVALMALNPGPKYAGLDNPRLGRHEPLRLDPWPQLSMELESRLFEQDGNGLLGQALKVLISGGPIMGAQGEFSLLPAWLESSKRRSFLASLLAGLDGMRVEEIAQELRLCLVASGQASVRAGIEARLPLAPTHAIGRADGGIDLQLEARSLREYDSFVIRAGGAEDISVPAGLHVSCEPPAESPLPDPGERKCRAALVFSGLAVGEIEKWRPGCRFRRQPSPEGKTPGPVPLIPCRAWPPGAEAGAPAEIPWCD